MTAVEPQPQGGRALAQLEGNSAFIAEYTRHADRVYSHCLQRGCSREDAEDLTAEVFVLAWKNRPKVYLDQAWSMLPWLLVTANNLLRHRGRSIVRARTKMTRFALERGIPLRTEVDTEQAEDDRVRHAEVASVLRSLSTRDQEIIQLCVIQGLTSVAVGGALNASPGAIRARLMRALERAKNALAATQTAHLEDRSLRTP